MRPNGSMLSGRISVSMGQPRANLARSPETAVKATGFCLGAQMISHRDNGFFYLPLGGCNFDLFIIKIVHIIQ